MTLYFVILDLNRLIETVQMMGQKMLVYRIREIIRLIIPDTTSFLELWDVYERHYKTLGS